MGLAVAAMTQVAGAQPAAAAEEKTRVAIVPLPQCPNRDLLAGKPDAFAPGGVETAAPSATLKAAVGGPFASFDGNARDVHFAHTFQLPRCGCIVGAKLSFAAKALGSSGSSSSGNDSLTLGFSGITGFPHWSAWLGAGPSTVPSLSSPAWGLPPLQRTFTLDLAAVPTTAGTVSLLFA